MEHYSTVKNDIKFEGKWIEQKMMLNEVIQIQNEKYVMYSFVSGY